MPFIANDLYLASGTGELKNAWIDTVYKHDSSSFYNWEEDNLPLYDLEDRTNLLHEMAGYPADDTVDTIMLIVSGTGADNKKVFSSLSGVIDALPNVIRTPVIIEVCTSGYIGDLKLENKIISTSGGLEIINRGFAKALCGSGNPSSITTLAVSSYEPKTIGDYAYTISSIDLSNAMTDVYCVGLSGVPVGTPTGGYNAWWDYYARSYGDVIELGQKDSPLYSRTVLSDFNSVNTGLALNVGINSFYAAGHPQAPQAVDSTSSTDLTFYTPIDPTIYRKGVWLIPGTANSIGVPERYSGLHYANALSKVEVKNCVGPIYIRGFCVDGAYDAASLDGGGTQHTDIGFDIQNSNVVFENCAVSRCKRAGLKAENSNVTLNRGFVSIRNYTLSGAGLTGKDTKLLTPGLHAVNSNITLSASTEELKGLPIDSPYQFCHNMVGIQLENSVLKTPEHYTYGRDMAGVDYTEIATGEQTLVTQTFGNISKGIIAKSSTIDLNGIFSVFNNKLGLELFDSIVKTSEMFVEANIDIGLRAFGSTIEYNKDTNRIARTTYGPQVKFVTNGQHMCLTNSEFIPTYASGIGDKCGRVVFVGNVGADFLNNEASIKPSIILDNSYMNLINGKAYTGGNADKHDVFAYNRPTKGALFVVTNNSTLDLNGTEDFATMLVGPHANEWQRKCAAIFVENGSTVNVAGPTSISQVGVNILAEKNSNINFGPHKRNGIIDVSGFLLLEDEDNHTKVELHSSRACLVAKGGSVISMENVGDYHAHWDEKYYEDGGINVDYPTGDTEVSGYQNDVSSAISGGYIQFFPNPNVLSSVHNISEQITWPITQEFAVTDDTFTSISMSPAQLSSVSLGGFCVRALEGSKVYVKNVHFPAGWENPSGPYYDISGTACDYLRIWNIGADSFLNASYLSVSSNHPQDASSVYYGPSAMWVSGGDTGLSGAPSSTADTSTASVLDTFGLGVETGGGLGYYGETVQKNIGPFRIFVSPHPKAKFLGYPVTEIGEGFMPAQPPEAFVSMAYDFDVSALRTGIPVQLFAQGYNPSGDLSAVNYPTGNNYVNVSDVYKDLGFAEYIESLPVDQQAENVASSFYYAGDMLPDDMEFKIILDESALNTFANAKNGTLNTSGRKAFVSFYRAIMSYPGDSFYGSANSQARGIGSLINFDLERDG